MRDKDKPESIGDIVIRALEAMQKNINEDEAEEEYKKQKMIEDRYKRTARLREAAMINVLDEECFKNISWDQLEATRSFLLVQQWMKTNVPFIFLTGPSGVGKTVAGAWAIANFGGMFLRAQTLERAGMAVYGPYNDLLEKAFTERLLLVDDIGTELRVTEFTGVLGELVNNRVGGRMKTIFTSNLERSRLEKRYFGKRELSRLAGAAFYVTDDTEDMRITNAGR